MKKLLSLVILLLPVLALQAQDRVGGSRPLMFSRGS
jgi:hypothetical protein